MRDWLIMGCKAKKIINAAPVNKKSPIDGYDATPGLGIKVRRRCGVKGKDIVAIKAKTATTRAALWLLSGNVYIYFFY